MPQAHISRVYITDMSRWMLFGDHRVELCSLETAEGKFRKEQLGNHWDREVWQKSFLLLHPTQREQGPFAIIRDNQNLPLGCD